MAFVVIWGFAVVYLQYKGFSNTEIGTVMTLGTILSVVLQPLLASALEKSRRLEIRNLTLVLVMILIGLMGGLIVSPLNKITIAVLYIISGGLAISFPAFLNTLGLSYSNRGIFLNYGLARGLGSLTFSVMSLILGWMVKLYSPSIIPFVYLIFLIMMFIILLGIKSLKEEPHQEGKKMYRGGFKEFAVRYRKFLVLLFGITLLFAGHYIVNTYMINIIQYVGGDSSHLGIAMGEAAALEVPTMLMFAYLVRKISVGKLLKISAFLYVIKSLILCFAPNMGMVFLSQAFQVGSFALFIPTSVFYVNQIIDPEYHATGQAVMGVATMGLGGALGNLLGGKLLDTAGVPYMLKVCVAVTFAGFLITMFFTEEKELG